jgi:CHAD domain-containing protein
MEIEAKFAIPNRAVYRRLARLRALAGYALTPIAVARVTDRYFDAADGRLLAAGYACRLRAEGDAVIATLKGLGGAAGAVHRRAEEEVRLPVWTPDVAAWPASPARTLALELAGSAGLEPLFELTQTRAKADVLDGERRVAQLSLDAVRAAVGQRPALYYELEVELAPDGTEADLAKIASELATAWGLTPEPRSKFERALATLRARGTAVESRLSAEERTRLEALAASPDPDLAHRAAVVLGWADGLPTREIVGRSQLSAGRVRFWLRAFRAERMGIFPTGPTAHVTVAQPEDQPLPSEDTEPAPRTTERALPTTEYATRNMSPQSVYPLPSVARFCRQHGVDMVHARHVAAQARILFDALKSTHDLPRKRRRLLKFAALLHTVGMAADPERHYAVGRDLILAQPLRGVSTADRLALACIVAFNRNKVRPEREPTMAALDGKMRSQVVTLAALLHVAEALDFSRTQTTQVFSVEGADTKRCELTLTGPHAEVDAVQAASQADLWYELFKQELLFLPEAPESVGEPALPTGQPLGQPASHPPPGQPTSQPIRPDEPMSEAGRKVIHLHFTRMIANEPGTRQGQDPEALHDMRVATRRMRAAFQLFAPYFDAKALAPFGKRLRRLGRTLGAVRDLDVLLQKAQAYAAGLPPDQTNSLDPLLAAWQTHREVARRRMLEYLDSSAYRKFVTEFETFLTTPHAGAVAIPSGEPEPYQVRHIVPRLIFAHYESVRAYEPLLPGAALDTLHQLRIECKGLRYALEFFRDVLGSEAPDLIKQVVAMQDLLGELQDARVAEGLIAEFLAEERSKKKKKRQAPLEGVEAYLAAQRAAQTDLLARFPAAWAVLAGYDFRRGLGLTVAAL